MIRPTTLLGLLLPFAAISSARAQDFVDVNGLHAVNERPPGDPRLFDVTFATAAIDPKSPFPPSTSAIEQPEARARILLPASYDDGQELAYPVLFLLHGGTGSYVDWTADGGADVLAADLELIVVMPEGGGKGWYTDWFVREADDTPRYETFHIHQLVRWIDVNLRTHGTREGRAIAGLSMGGFGALSYAARHPDLFVAAASFSGGLDMTYSPQQIIVWASGIGAAADANAIFGPYNNEPLWAHNAQQLNYRAHNPVDLVENLGPVDLTYYSGTDDDGQIHVLNQRFHAAVAAAGFDPERSVCTNGACTVIEAGTGPRYIEETLANHSFTWWSPWLADWLPHLMAVFAAPPPAPTAFTYTSADDEFAAFGYEVSMLRAVAELATLVVEGPESFTLDGSGEAEVTTAPLYVPGAPHSVAIEDGQGVATEYAVFADAGGRITTPLVVLGPDNPYQQYQGAPSTFYTATVSITPL
ncbi:alpha/beta hydrolase family protein [Nannocystis sp. RBIL2]|uniref:alpha/beta hydrolase n=1 Tax=Nannocystis sp. RBIL2 TaxID=2996788 RepID=UPI00226E3370|nr:alpha/beta hydrolase family protein [Nannocystis sp. RBIL2]MCY1071241.1 alpha/beta hydrolase family protein [Nannocystis sp. RBIL2]